MPGTFAGTRAMLGTLTGTRAMPGTLTVTRATPGTPYQILYKHKYHDVLPNHACMVVQHLHLHFLLLCLTNEFLTLVYEESEQCVLGVFQ